MEIQRVAVIGAGTMGHALALVHALGGCPVNLFDSSPEVLSGAPVRIAAACGTLEEAGRISEEQAQAALQRIAFSGSLAEAVATADLIVEAVVEKAGIKRSVFAEIDAHAPMEAVIASNTSYLDVFPLIPQARQATSAIAHWYTPPYIVDLVDLVSGPRTNPEIVPALKSLYEGWGKAPLEFDTMVPGYIANRLQAALNLECLRMIEEFGVSAEDIDFSIRHGLVERLAVLGHMRKMDFTGLEMVRNGIASGTYQPPVNNGQSPVLDRLIEDGRSGVGAGAGFFDYGGASAEELFHDRDLRLLKFKTQLKNLMGEKQ
ncbi:3-hydroxyacyl-CoA dehydrogenase family protein [Roseibium aggregatum]|uniref:3-hydroxyacyl-CoA dehydrogenase family protein n=1 Tax=Roseibium aggregatum TaxID=187304 RepID=A0A939EH90_9HYPH|nr:3-hydroxyacyl-CoA dehydrogenase family protein [Roseibium aggregatum]MBN9671710.1 3-hydroxyacyl-CoA dehydrogenase family protein [Roseibium aggregatum]